MKSSIERSEANLGEMYIATSQYCPLQFIIHQRMYSSSYQIINWLQNYQGWGMRVGGGKPLGSDNNVPFINRLTCVHQPQIT